MIARTGERFREMVQVPVLVITFREITKGCPAIITRTGAKLNEIFSDSQYRTGIFQARRLQTLYLLAKSATLSSLWQLRAQSTLAWLVPLFRWPLAFCLRERSESFSGVLLKFQRVTIRGAQPSWGSLRKYASQRGSWRPLRGPLRGLCGALRGSAGFSEGSGPMLVTLPNCLSSGALGVLNERSTPLKALSGALRAKWPKALSRNNLWGTSAWALRHSCKWPAGSRMFWDKS